MSRFRFLRAGAALTAAAFFATAYAAGGPQSILPEYRLNDSAGSDQAAKSGSQLALVAAPLFAGPQAAASGNAGAAKPEPASPAVAAEATPLLTFVKPVAAAVRTGTPPAVAEQRLAADIQSNLRRLGCYAGALHGEWDATTRAAMSNALAAANARLSVKSADVTLLAIVEAQSDDLCRRAPAAPRIETAATPAVRTAPASLLPGMMSVGGPRTESGEASASAAPGISLTQRPPAQGGVAAMPPKPRSEAARKRAPSRSSDSFFTHPLNREPY